MPDLRIVIRMLRKAPGLALVAVACLSVGIGLTTAAFHVIYGAFLAALPVEGGERLVMVREYHRAGRYNVSTTPEQFYRWRDHARSFEALGAWQVKNVPLQAENAATTIVRAAYVTSNAPAMVDTKPRLGRSLTQQDAAPGAPPVIVLSDAVWRSQFAADAGVIGRIARVGTELHSVIGVMPERFAFPVREYAWLPLPDDASASLPAGENVQVFAKLRPAVALETAQAELAALREMNTTDALTRAQTEVLLRPFTRGYMAPEEEWAVYGVLLGLLLFLLVTAGNLANLLLARNAARMGGAGASRAMQSRQ